MQWLLLDVREGRCQLTRKAPVAMPASDVLAQMLQTAAEIARLHHVTQQVPRTLRYGRKASEVPAHDESDFLSPPPLLPGIETSCPLLFSHAHTSTLTSFFLVTVVPFDPPQPELWATSASD